MSHVRIKLTDSTMDVVIKMTDGNPGAMIVLYELIADNTTDPDGFMGGLGYVLLLDTFGIYGSDIYILHSDICNRDLVKMQAVLRATQMGMFSSATLKDACHRQDYSGRDMIPVEELYLKVKEELPNFNSKKVEVNAL